MVPIEKKQEKDIIDILRGFSEAALSLELVDEGTAEQKAYAEKALNALNKVISRFKVIIAYPDEKKGEEMQSELTYDKKEEAIRSMGDLIEALYEFDQCLIPKIQCKSTYQIGCLMYDFLNALLQPDVLKRVDDVISGENAGRAFDAICRTTEARGHGLPSKHLIRSALTGRLGIPGIPLSKALGEGITLFRCRIPGYLLKMRDGHESSKGERGKKGLYYFLQNGEADHTNVQEMLDPIQSLQPNIACLIKKLQSALEITQEDKALTVQEWPERLMTKKKLLSASYYVSKAAYDAYKASKAGNAEAKIIMFTKILAPPKKASVGETAFYKISLNINPEKRQELEDRYDLLINPVPTDHEGRLEVVLPTQEGEAFHFQGKETKKGQDAPTKHADYKKKINLLKKVLSVIEKQTGEDNFVVLNYPKLASWRSAISDTVEDPDSPSTTRHYYNYHAFMTKNGIQYPPGASKNTKSVAYDFLDAMGLDYQSQEEKVLYKNLTYYHGLDDYYSYDWLRTVDTSCDKNSPVFRLKEIVEQRKCALEEVRGEIQAELDSTGNPEEKKKGSQEPVRQEETQENHTTEETRVSGPTRLTKRYPRVVSFLKLVVGITAAVFFVLGVVSLLANPTTLGVVVAVGGAATLLVLGYLMFRQQGQPGKLRQPDASRQLLLSALGCETFKDQHLRSDSLLLDGLQHHSGEVGRQNSQPTANSPSSCSSLFSSMNLRPGSPVQGPG